MCSFTLGFDWLDVRSLLQCKSYCEQGEYKINSTIPAIASVQKQSNLPASIKSTSPACPPCPMEATCGRNGILPLPDYWGYAHGSQNIRMVRYSKDYCCTGSKDCKTIDSCNAGRMGQICGRCQHNMSESLFSTNCVSTANCQTALVLIFYLLASVTYAAFLMTFRDIKRIVSRKMKSASKYLNGKLTGFKHKHVRNNEQRENVNKNEAGPSHKSQLVDSLLLCDHYSNQKSNLNKEFRSLESLIKPTVNGDHRVKAMNNDNVQNPVTSDTYMKETSSTVHKEKDSGMKYLQILFYYVQDVTLFKVYLPAVGAQKESRLHFSPDNLSHIKLFPKCAL